jgi:hypothetical protein
LKETKWLPVLFPYGLNCYLSGDGMSTFQHGVPALRFPRNNELPRAIGLTSSFKT